MFSSTREKKWIMFEHIKTKTYSCRLFLLGSSETSANTQTIKLSRGKRSSKRGSTNIINWRGPLLLRRWSANVQFSRCQAVIERTNESSRHLKNFPVVKNIFFFPKKILASLCVQTTSRIKSRNCCVLSYNFFSKGTQFPSR